MDFGPYELRTLLGRGGMGEVYRAYDRRRDREVALKLLPSHLATDPEFQARFRRESQIAARLAEPHIIPIHDFGEIDGRLYIDMRLVEGQDLGALLKARGPLSIDVALDVLEQVASALDSAHDHGLVHRDVKPQNILVTGLSGATIRRPFVYLVDFGIARPTSPDSTGITTTEGGYGTAAYMSPDRIAGAPGDRRTDVYALACVLYEMLTGHRPWEGDIYTVLSGHMNSPPPDLSARLPGCPAGLDAAIRKGLAKHPDQRWDSAGRFAAAARAAVVRTSRVQPPSSTIPTMPPSAPQPQQDPTGRSSTEEAHAPRTTRRNGWGRVAGAVAAVLMVVAGVVAAISLTQSEGTPIGGAGPTLSSGPTPSPTASSSAPPDTLVAGSGTSVSWSDFASFSALVGERDKDTAHSFQGLSCRLDRPRDGDPAGLAESVICGGIADGVNVFVARFTTPDEARKYTNDLLLDRFSPAYAWGEGGVARGLVYFTEGNTTADADAFDVVICGLPTYVVRILINDAALSGPDARTQLLDAATFPDVVPPRCKDDFSGAVDDRVGDRSRAGKPRVSLTARQVDELLVRDEPTASRLESGTESTSAGIDAVRFDQSGHVSFWSADKDGLRRIAARRFPVADPAGYFSKSLGGEIAGLRHAAFVFDGPFFGSARQYLVFAYGPAGWGVVTPSGPDKLVVSKSTATKPAAFTKARVAGDALVTTAGSITTTWKWTGTSFVVADRSG